MSSHTPARPSPYAPPSASVPQILPSSISLDEVPSLVFVFLTFQEVKLHNGTPAQRRVWDDLATIYSIIVCLEFVEKAYVRDTITQAQSSTPHQRKLLTSRYTQKCSNLLTQYKAILKDAEVQERFGDLEQFQKLYNVQFTSATYRLKVGVPATVEHAGSHHHIPSTSESSTDQVNARHIAETVEVPPTTTPHRNSALDFLLTVEIHYVYGRTQTELSIKRSITSTFIRFNDFVEYEYATRL
jgi:hypothetical protein